MYPLPISSTSSYLCYSACFFRLRSLSTTWSLHVKFCQACPPRQPPSQLQNQATFRCCVPKTGHCASIPSKHTCEPSQHRIDTVAWSPIVIVAKLDTILRAPELGLLTSESRCAYQNEEHHRKSMLTTCDLSQEMSKSRQRRSSASRSPELRRFLRRRDVRRGWSASICRGAQ